MSQYNKTVLTRAGLELAKRANAGQAKFGITRAVTSADDWSYKTVQDLEEVTTIPNIMQQGTIMDANEVESNNSVIGVSLCFTNKNLSTGYQIRVIGLYVKEEGQENDFLYAVTTAITPEYMPSFADKVLYRFNMQMYCVIGKTQAVNVVIDDGTAVTHGQLDKYKVEVTENLKKLENTHKEDMSHVAKSASVNGGAEILPDSTGKLNLVVPDPDLSKYVSLEQLGELLKAKADKANTYTKSNIDDIHSKSYFRKQGIDENGNVVEIRTNAVKQSNGGYAIDIYDTDWTASKLADVLTQLPNKADTSTVNAQIADVKDTVQFNLDKAKSDLNDAINTKANSDDVYNKPTIDSAFNTRDNSINRAQSTADGAQTTANNALPKAGGNMNLRSTINWNGGGINDRTGNLGGLQWAGGTDTVSIYGDQDGNNNLDLTFDLGDDGSNHFSFRNKGSEVAGIQSNGHYTGTVDWGNVWGRPDVTPIVNGAADDDLFAFKSNQIRLYPGNGKNCKNLPPASNTQWFTVQYVFENPNGDGVAIFRSPANEVWMVGNNGGSYSTGWTRLANSGDISNLQNIINQQNQTIQSLTTRLTNAENEIRYIKENYIEGRRFPASQEAQAEAWENEKPTRLAMIEK